MKTILLSSIRPNTRRGFKLSTSIGQIASRGLKQFKVVGLLAALLTVGAPQLYASDPVGIFALIEKVVLEPNDAAPERAQIWGAFAVADGKRGNQYESPKTGYFYYKLPAEKAAIALKEWSDLKASAGKREVIGFGARYGELGKLRKVDEKPANPDSYPVGFGLTKMKDRTSNYPPIQQLLASAPPKAAENKK
jgi:hypothetical protein